MSFLNKGYYVKVYEKYTKGKKEYLKEYATIYLGYHNDTAIDKLNTINSKFPESEGFVVEILLFDSMKINSEGEPRKQRVRLEVDNA